jgi:hypothetical protein
MNKKTAKALRREIYGDAATKSKSREYRRFGKMIVATEARRAYRLAKRAIGKMGRDGYPVAKVIKNLHPSLTAYKK